jgi:hypothetical protein
MSKCQTSIVKIIRKCPGMPERKEKSYSGGGIFYRYSRLYQSGIGIPRVILVPPYSRITQALPSYALNTVHAAACRPVMQPTCDRSQQRNSSSGKIISLKNLPTGNLAVITNPYQALAVGCNVRTNCLFEHC